MLFNLSNHQKMTFSLKAMCFASLIALTACSTSRNLTDEEIMAECAAPHEKQVAATLKDRIAQYCTADMARRARERSLESKSNMYVGLSDQEIIAQCAKKVELGDKASIAASCGPGYVAFKRRLDADFAAAPKVTMYEALGVTPEMVRKQREQDRQDATNILSGQLQGSTTPTNAQQPSQTYSSVGTGVSPNASQSPSTVGQTPAQVAQQKNFSSASTSASESNSQPAMQCISVIRPKGSNWALMQNLCPHYITVDWCYAGAGGDCTNGTWGGGNLGNIAPNSNRQASTFISGAKQYGLYFSVCSGRDASIQVTGPKTFTCK